MRRLLREPLLHFLALGAAIFALDAWLRGEGAGAPDEIVVTREQIDSLATGFLRTWQRPPTPEEREGLVREHVRDEVYAREAIRLGLDRDDSVIRRRLRQKLEFIAEDAGGGEPIGEEDLARHLAAHPERFAVAAETSFEHVYLSPDRHPGTLEADTEALLARLRAGGGSEGAGPALGDPFLLGDRFEAMPSDEISETFGEAFAHGLARLPVQSWEGPVPSGYGVHLVRVAERSPGRAAELAEVRDAVRRDLEHERRLHASEAYFQELLGRYRVRIEADGAAP
jgi:hypothetical protein